MKPLAQLHTAGDGGTQSVADRRTDAAGETSLGLVARVDTSHEFWAEVPSGYVKIAMDTGHLWWVFPVDMVIF